MIVRFATLYPGVVRQALLDMEPKSRALTKAILCQSPALARIQPKPDCDGLVGGPLPGKTLEIRRNSYQWPYPTKEIYSIKRESSPPDAPYEVALKVNMIIDPKMSDKQKEEALKKIAAWQSQTNDYLNCQSGAVSSYSSSPTDVRSCPPDPALKRSPGVKFSIVLNPTDDASLTPQVTVHACYNCEIPAREQRSDCAEVKKHAKNKCLAGGKKTEAQCSAEIDGREPEAFNRADAQNYELKATNTTVFHEVGHLLGLRDEYADPTYPINDLGEHNSIMANSNSDDSRLFPRHLDQILSPAIDCQKAAAPN
jgi:hypothetical protein